MNKDDGFICIENKIRFTWQVRSLSTVSYPRFVQKLG